MNFVTPFKHTRNLYSRAAGGLFCLTVGVSKQASRQAHTHPHKVSEVFLNPYVWLLTPFGPKN